MSSVPSSRAIPLSRFAEDHPAAADLLAGSTGHSETAALLNSSQEAVEAGFTTTEASVRRYRDKQATAKPRTLTEILASPYASQEPPEVAPRGRATSVPAWRTGSDIGNDEGEIRTRPVVVAPGQSVPDPDNAALLEEFGLDPNIWEAVAVRRSRWQQREDGDWLEAHRVSVRRRAAGHAGLDPAALEAILSNYTYPVPDPKVRALDGGILMVPVGDLQVGKPDGGGTAAIVDRFSRLTEQVRQRILATPTGRVQALILPWLGDCIEGYVSQNGKLPLDVSITEAVRIIRRLMLHQLAVLSPLADRVLVVAIAGNHDEVRRDRTAPMNDSWALDAASAVADALELSGQYEHVTFIFPEREELTVTVDVGSEEHPYVIAFTHGHVVNSPDRMLGWWEDQAFGRQKAGEADMLVSAHFHHYRNRSAGRRRTWLQIPALDGGSPWYRVRKGEDQSAGMVSVWIEPASESGWSSLTVHS
jgi:3',5'-cyclic AMP phosphodiesterase CpdA